nr:phage portal protein [Clostridia bacterium]
YDVLGETELLKTMLYAGEYAELAQAAQKLSGLDDDINEDIEEIKNA